MTTSMMNLVADPKAGWNLSVSGARRAAERAKNAATVTYDWASRAGLGMVDAAEALAAAERAMDAADRTSIATSREEIRTEAINAWSAAEAALAADKRASATITAALWAEEDRKALGTSSKAA